MYKFKKICIKVFIFIIATILAVMVNFMFESENKGIEAILLGVRVYILYTIFNTIEEER